MSEIVPPALGEEADEAAWRAAVEKALAGAPWDKLTSHTADGVPIAPLYRETDFATATDVSGFPGAAPFVRGHGKRGWLIRQRFDHFDPERTNRDIHADLQGGVASIELALAWTQARGVRIQRDSDFDRVLAGVILDAAPVSLDAGAGGLWAAEMLAAKLKGATGVDVAFNLDPLGRAMQVGMMHSADIADCAAFARRMRDELPAATVMRIDARPVHEAGGTEAQELGAALACGIAYLKALTDAGLSIDEAAGTLLFTFSVGPDVLVEAAKLRALRLAWARILEASGASPEARGARIHAVTSRRIMTRYDAHGNILRVTSAAVASAIGGADAITTLPFTDALGLPTPFARRLARNTQHVLLEEAHLGHVADPAGGSWFVEKLTRDLGSAGWAKMQRIEGGGGIVAALHTQLLTSEVMEARFKRQRDIDARRETITGVSDYPLLGATMPTHEGEAPIPPPAFHGPVRQSDMHLVALNPPIRWASRFEKLRDVAEAERPRPAVFFANMDARESFTPRAIFAQTLFAIGGVGAIGAEDQHATPEALAEAFKASGALAAVLTGSDDFYAAHTAGVVAALKTAGCAWVLLASMPRDAEQSLRGAGVDQFLFEGQDAFAALSTLHAALGLSP